MILPQAQELTALMGKRWRACQIDDADAATTEIGQSNRGQIPFERGEFELDMQRLADMLDVFWDLDYVPKGRPAGDFLDEHLDGIAEAAAYHTGHAVADLKEVGLAYRDAADFHDLVVSQRQEANTIAAFAIKARGKRREV